MGVWSSHRKTRPTRPTPGGVGVWPVFAARATIRTYVYDSCDGPVERCPSTTWEMPLNEADTRAKLIDPALRKRGWREDWIRREQTPGPFVRTDSGYARGQGVLHVLVREEMVPLAVVEAKAEDAAPDAGIEQAKRDARLHHVPFAFATNGHQFHEADLRTNASRGPLPMGDFPKPDELRKRWQRRVGKTAALDSHSDDAKPLWTRPREGARYYQRAARRAALESIARGEKRVLLPLATGAGKTWIAVSILRAVSEARQLRRALFLCDRDELRNQALGALSAHFESDAAKATTRDPAKNARVIVATYQTLGIDREDGDASFLRTHYPQGHFSHIIIDECHRSAWGKWSEVLRRNPDAIQIGLTATPRDIDTGESQDVEAAADEQISANNYQYFGEPAYEYSIAQAMQDGYLAAMEVVRSDVWTAETLDRLEGVAKEHLRSARRVTEVRSNEIRDVDALREQYAPSALEQDLLLPDRVSAMTADLFKRLLSSGGPFQKTLIFCASVSHTNAVVETINNLYAEWQRHERGDSVEPYAFACTAKGGRELIADLRGSRHRAFVAATVDLITTGVDVPCLQNVVYFRYIKSPILFHQMLGRGTRIDEATGKRHFTVYDYTNATRLLDAPLKQRQAKQPERRPPPPEEPVESYRVEGVEVRIEGGERRVGLVAEDGKMEFLTLEDYGKRIASAVQVNVSGLDELRNRWLRPERRSSLLKGLAEHGINLSAYRSVADRLDTDGYDLLASLGWGETIRSRVERTERIGAWLDNQGQSAPILTALANQFGVAGTEALESRHLGQVTAIKAAGGLVSLDGDVVFDLKRRLLATDAEWAA